MKFMVKVFGGFENKYRSEGWVAVFANWLSFRESRASVYVEEYPVKPRSLRLSPTQ